jgi:hypothetical protein
MKFILFFIVVAIIYSFLSVATTLFYDNKSPVELSEIERKILNGSASLKEKFKFFFLSIILSVFAPPVYILAGIITFIFWIV